MSARARGGAQRALTTALAGAKGTPGGPVTRLAVVVSVVDLDDDGTLAPRQVLVRYEGDTVPSERALLAPGSAVPTVAAGDRVLLLAAGATWVVVANLTADAPSPPYGTVIISATPVDPPGWVKCNGQSVLRTAFPRLFDAIGTLHGEGATPGSTFALPAMTHPAAGRLHYVIRAR